MKIKSILVLLLLGFGLTVQAQQPGAADDRFAQELRQKSALVKAITCRFDQVQSLSVLSHKVTKSGDFYYQHPEHLLLDFDNGDFIYMSADRFSMKTAGKTTQVKVEKNPMLRELKRILSACLTGNVLQITKEFKHQLSEDQKGYVLTLVPKKRRMASRVKEIVLNFNRTDMCLDRMQMTQSNGDYTLYEFSKKTINGKISPDIFKSRK